MKFLRANPNLLLKLIPTTLAVDEQGIEKMERQKVKMNQDLIGVQKNLKIKSSKGKRKTSKSNFYSKIIERKIEKPGLNTVNKSQVLAFSSNPGNTKKATVIDDTFYSDNKSMINRSNANISMFGTKEGIFNNKKRKSNYRKLAEQLPGVNLPQNLFGGNALSKADSVYSSNNVPNIKDFNGKKVRPLSMKQPRRLRHKIDEKYSKMSDISRGGEEAMPTIWNSKNPNSFVQVPFKNIAMGMDTSFASTNLMKSPDFRSQNLEQINENLK